MWLDYALIGGMIVLVVLFIFWFAADRQPK